MNVDKYQKQKCREVMHHIVKRDGYNINKLTDWNFRIVHDEGVWVYWYSAYCPERDDRCYASRHITDAIHDAMESY